MRVDPSSSKHPYQQLADHLRARIRMGQITAQLPSLTELTAKTGLAVGTVRRAIEILVQEGLVERVPGRGTFVKRLPKASAEGTASRVLQSTARSPEWSWSTQARRARGCRH